MVVKSNRFKHQEMENVVGTVVECNDFKSTLESIEASEQRTLVQH